MLHLQSNGVISNGLTDEIHVLKTGYWALNIRSYPFILAKRHISGVG